MAVGEGRVVPADHGLQWARDGVELVSAAPVVWLGMALLFVLLGVALSIVPGVSLLWNVAVPILLGGVMLGCEAMRQGRPLEVRHLFAGFEAPRMQQLALVGALYLAASILLIVLGVGIALGGSLLSAAMLGSGAFEQSPALVVGLVATGIIVFGALAILLSMTIWFAPALVALDGVAALEAMRISLYASLRNTLPLLVYGLVLIGVGLLVMAPFIAALILLPLYQPTGTAPLMIAVAVGRAVFLVICAVAIAPTIWGAMYASYRDVFCG
ncbi:MAG: BPSS1780 family membrane protein [Luteitalea sp.]